MKTIPASVEAGRVDLLQSPRPRRLCAAVACASLVLFTTAASPAAGDYGDAPDGSDSYYPVLAGQAPIPGRFPTLYATGNSRVGAPGVRHTIVGEEWFGPPASPPSAEADAVDPSDPDGRNNLVNNDGFDDGLPPIPFFLLLTTLPPGAAITFRVTVAAGAPDVYRYVNMLIDWDRSGDWKNLSPPAAPEWVMVNRVVDVKPGTSQWITVPITWGLGAQLAPQIFWLRMSLSRTMLDPAVYGPDGWDGSGTFSHGETEDYLFHPSRKHSDPSPFPPPPLAPPPTGGYYSSLPGIVLVPQHLDVAHGTPATVTVQMLDFNTGLPLTAPPPAFLGWAVDDAFNGPPATPPPGSVPPYQVGGSISWPGPPPSSNDGSGSTATWTNGAAPNIASITVNSVVHDFSSPEEWAFRVRAEWPGVHLHTRKAIVHIFHSWPFWGCFAIYSNYTILARTIESLSGLTPGQMAQLLVAANAASNAWQLNNLPAMNGHLDTVALHAGDYFTLGLISMAQRDEILRLVEGLRTGATAPMPVPVIQTPTDAATVRAITSVVATTLSPDVTWATFSFSGADGIKHPIGQDLNGADGWSVPWNTIPVADGIYQVYAAMENAGGLIGENQVSVWVDNTVPVPIPMTGPPIVVGLTELAVSAPDPGRDIASCSFAISRDGVEWYGLPTDCGGDNDEIWQTQLDTGQLEQGPYQVRATVSDEAGNEATAVWLMDVQPSYAAWKHQYGITDDAEDDDGDALSAAMEYYFGTNPTIADPAGSAYGLQQVPAEGWELWCKRRPWLDGLMAVAEESQNLLNWTELLRDPPAGAGTEMHIRINSGLPSNFARFRFIETR